jgi:hypothetical protein
MTWGSRPNENGANGPVFYFCPDAQNARLSEVR